jgi:hypothetical protein
METTVEKPRFDHDCGTCIYLGETTVDGTTFDLYFCMKGPGKTLIARYGNAGHEYLSGLLLADHVSPLCEARRRAVAARLLP